MAIRKKINFLPCVNWLNGLNEHFITVSDLNYYTYILSFLASFHYEPLKVIQHTQN